MDSACLSDLFDDYNSRCDSDERMDASGRRIHLHPYERYMRELLFGSGSSRLIDFVISYVLSCVDR